MSSLPQSFVLISPRQLIYDNPNPNEPVTQFITLQNTLTYPITLELKASNAFRYNLSATSLTLQSNESKQIDITLTLQQQQDTKSSTTIKDTFSIKSDFFNDHITSTIILSNHVHNNNNNNDLEINSVQSTNDGHDNNNDNNSNLDLMSLTSAITQISDHKSTKSYIHTLEQNVSELKVELDYLKSVKSEMNSQLPDLETIVDATISKERALNEVRNKKVLMILQSKDETIENLKAMSKNYQQMETALNVLQQKHINLSQTLQQAQEQNIALEASANSHKIQMSKLNEQMASFKEQNEFQKKVINERELRINELQSDIEQTQKMLQKSTKTIKESYVEQINELKLKLNASQEQFAQITKEFDEHKIENTKNVQLIKQILAENEDLKGYKAQNVASFEKELNGIKDECALTQGQNVQNVNALRIELAKLRSFVRLGMFNGANQSKYDGKDLDKQIMDDLARKSAHLSASKAIIQQQRVRINELEKLQKLSNESCFDASIKLSETNKKLTHSSSESHRLLAIHKRQIEILNKKLSNSIHCEEQSSIKLKALKQKLNHSETEYVEKIEELEEALQAINTLHTQKSSDKRKKGKITNTKSDMISLENELFSTQNELKMIRKRLKSEMNQRQNDIKTYHLKVTNLKKLHEKQQNRTQSLINSKGSNDANVHRLIELNKELAQSEKLKNEYLTQLQCIKQQTKIDQNETMTEDNNTHCHTQHRLLIDQSEEIKELKDMLSAAVSVKNFFTHFLRFTCLQYQIHHR